VVACGSDDGAVGLGTAGCLSDQQICQFKKGVSTKDDVQKALGNPQISLGSSAWSYVCQQISGQVIRNDQVIFDFNDSGVLSDVTVLRIGTSSPPAPDCEASGGAGGAPNNGSACSSVPRPAPDSTTCQNVTFGGSAPVTTNCMDQSGNTWSGTCSGASCNCSYNSAATCSCMRQSGGPACCPGLPGSTG
jgi:hypothetical protein